MLKWKKKTVTGLQLKVQAIEIKQLYLEELMAQKNNLNTQFYVPNKNYIFDIFKTSLM